MGFLLRLFSRQIQIHRRDAEFSPSTPSTPSRSTSAHYCNGWAAFSDVGVNNLLPFPLRFQDELHRVSECAFASGVRSDVVRFFLHFGAGIFHRDRQPSSAHGGEVDDIV